MDDSLRAEEVELFDQIGRLAESVWEATRGFEAPFLDLKMLSVLLFKRLYSNHLGFALLWKHPLKLEASIVLRSGIEAAICIAANLRLGTAFADKVRCDAAATVQGQAKLHQANGEVEAAKQAEATMDFLLGGMPAGTRPAPLNWRSLAQEGEVPGLYGWYKMLSGLSSHVTGLSLMEGITDSSAEVASGQDDYHHLNNRLRPLMMAGATLTGTMLHARVFELAEYHDHAVDLSNELAALTQPERG